jgi:tryptophan-rich sensory protein
VLNAAWTWIFFGARRADAAFAEILVLDGAIVATITAFARVDGLAAGLLVPYLGWSLFATALTFALWRANLTEPLPRRE